MKIVLPIATVAAVTPLMLKHGSGEEATLVPAKSITFKAEVQPVTLNELREGLDERFFEAASEKGPRVPALPELDGAIGWRTEYEGGTLRLDLSQLEDLDFDDEELVLAGVEVNSITFEPLATGMVAWRMNAIVTSDDPEVRGKIDGLLRHTVSAEFTKLTQRPLAEPKKPKDDMANKQGELEMGAA